MKWNSIVMHVSQNRSLLLDVYWKKYSDVENRMRNQMPIKMTLYIMFHIVSVYQVLTKPFIERGKLRLRLSYQFIHQFKLQFSRVWATSMHSHTSSMNRWNDTHIIKEQIYLRKCPFLMCSHSNGSKRNAPFVPYFRLLHFVYSLQMPSQFKRNTEQIIAATAAAICSEHAHRNIAAISERGRRKNEREMMCHRANRPTGFVLAKR